jgi:hypothetical protein
MFVCGNKKYCLCRLRLEWRKRPLTWVGRRLNASTINFQPQKYRRFSGKREGSDRAFVRGWKTAQRHVQSCAITACTKLSTNDRNVTGNPTHAELAQAVETHRVVRRRGSHILSRQSAHRWWWGCQPYAPAALCPPGRFVVLISVRGWVDPRATMRLEGLGKLQQYTSSRLDPATFQLVA